MNWEKVKIVAQEGTEFGVLYDEKGVLTLVVKHPNGKWPHNLVPTAVRNIITKENPAYVVITDEHARRIMSEN